MRYGPLAQCGAGRWLSAVVLISESNLSKRKLLSGILSQNNCTARAEYQCQCSAKENENETFVIKEAIEIDCSSFLSGE